MVSLMTTASHNTYTSLLLAALMGAGYSGRGIVGHLGLTLDAESIQDARPTCGSRLAFLLRFLVG
jgi:hypothetical protein